MGANDREVDSIASVGSKSSNDRQRGEAAAANNVQPGMSHPHGANGQQANHLDKIRDTVHISGDE